MTRRHLVGRKPLPPAGPQAQGWTGKSNRSTVSVGLRWVFILSPSARTGPSRLGPAGEGRSDGGVLHLHPRGQARYPEGGRRREDEPPREQWRVRANAKDHEHRGDGHYLAPLTYITLTCLYSAPAGVETTKRVSRSQRCRATHSCLGLTCRCVGSRQRPLTRFYIRQNRRRNGHSVSDTLCPKESIRPKSPRRARRTDRSPLRVLPDTLSPSSCLVGLA